MRCDGSVLHSQKVSCDVYLQLEVLEQEKLETGLLSERLAQKSVVSSPGNDEPSTAGVDLG